jgi:hypothetical protein
MKKNLLVIVLMLMVSAPFIKGQTSPKEKGLETITLNEIKGQLEFLASDWTEGRSTGDKGYYLASDYVASMLKVFGAAGAGDVESGGRSGRMMFAPPSGPGGQGGPGRTPPAKSYFQNFTLIENIPGGTSTLAIKKAGNEYAFEEGIDFTIGRSAGSAKFDAPVIFVGYGIVDKDKGIDDFAGVDVKGKVILRLSGFPGQNDQNSAMYKKFVGDNPRNAFEMMRRKNDAINNRGIVGVIDITDITFSQDLAKRWGTYRFDNNLSPAEASGRGSRVSLRLDSKEVVSSPVNITVTPKVMNLLLKDSGLDLVKYEKDAAAGLVKPKPVTLPGLTVAMNISTKSRRVNVRNVVAMIEGENKNEIVVTGAHLDHLGINNGLIWNGTDDNASGVVAVMTIAKAFAASGVKPKRTIVFCAWAGEEQGLLGSEYYTQYPTVGKISDVKFYMNFDMIARDAANDTAKNMAGFTYTKAYPKLEEITKANAAQYKVNLKLNIRSEEAPTGGSDFTAFTENKIPIIEWMAAMHTDYHQPSDQVASVNWNKMLDIIKLGYLQLWDIVEGEIK